MFDHTLISQENPLYSAIAGLNKGQQVLFSGSFLPSNKRDYVEEGSVSEEGSMSDPEFIFRFESIRENQGAQPNPVQDRLQNHNLSSSSSSPPLSAFTAPGIIGTWKGHTLNERGGDEDKEMKIKPILDNSYLAGFDPDEDKYRGMKIKPVHANFEVTFSVKAPECVGQVVSFGYLSGNILTVRNFPTGGEKDNQVCTITVKFAGNTAEINENNCTYYHGVACSFDGTLKKVLLPLSRSVDPQ